MSRYPLHPDQTHASPLYATVPLAEYEKLKAKLDKAEKACIHYAELYRQDKQLFNTEMEKLMMKIDEGMTDTHRDIVLENESLKRENETLKELNARLCERVTENDGIRQHWEEIEQVKADNEALKRENNRLKKALDRHGIMLIEPEFLMQEPPFTEAK